MSAAACCFVSERWTEGNGQREGCVSGRLKLAWRKQLPSEDSLSRGLITLFQTNWMESSPREQRSFSCSVWSYNVTHVVQQQDSEPVCCRWWILSSFLSILTPFRDSAILSNSSDSSRASVVAEKKEKGQPHLGLSSAAAAALVETSGTFIRR